MGQYTPTTDFMEQFDTLPIQYRHIEHMHEGVWLKKRQNDSYENLDIFSIISRSYMHESGFMSRLTPTTAFDGSI